MFLVLAKDTSGPHWPRLLKQKGRPPKSVQLNWDLWKDEEDEEAETNKKEFNIGDLDDMHVCSDLLTFFLVSKRTVSATLY